ncbi:MAG: phosphotransferase [Rickettsiaceae bacterium]|nr:phosphotransferase [Rickettsiaceae bacterium]
MKILTSNITNLFQDKGRSWLDNIQNIVSNLASIWCLSDIQPVSNMTFNYVFKAIRNNKENVVVKFSCDENLTRDEIKALDHLAGSGTVKLLDHNEQYHALLLEQAIPGRTLKEFRNDNLDLAMKYYIDVMHNLHNRPCPDLTLFPEIKKWPKAFDRVDESKMPDGLLHKARSLAQELVATQKHKILLHGDLHLDNILQNGNDWLAIDPKGIIGEAEFEIAAFDFIADFELDSNNNLAKLYHDRLEKIASKSGLNLYRIKGWCTVRLALAIAWSLEDNTDPSKWVKLYDAFSHSDNIT